MNKIERSIELIRKSESLALKMSPEGFHLAFSGGKDSQVIYELCKMANVKFSAHMQITTIDPPPVLKFIRDKYPAVELIKPEKSFFKWIETKQLPTRQIRWCCEELKEVGGKNHVVIMGIRKAESAARSKRSEIEEHKNCSYNKIMLNPILDWTNADVWTFIRKNIGYWCELYDQGYSRIGCIGCPMQNAKQRINDFKMFPRFKYPIVKSIQKNIDKGKYGNFENAEDVFNWWIGNYSAKEYLAQKNQQVINFKWI